MCSAGFLPSVSDLHSQLRSVLPPYISMKVYFLFLLPVFPLPVLINSERCSCLTWTAQPFVNECLTRSAKLLEHHSRWYAPQCLKQLSWKLGLLELFLCPGMFPLESFCSFCSCSFYATWKLFLSSLLLLLSKSGSKKPWRRQSLPTFTLGFINGTQIDSPKHHSCTSGH